VLVVSDAPFEITRNSSHLKKEVHT